MAIETIIRHTADLAAGVTLRALRPALLTGDRQAHRFVIAVGRAGQRVDLSGAAVTAYMIRRDKTTVLIPGEITPDNEASILLPEACYSVPGRFSLVTKLTLGDATSTIDWCEGAVGASQTGDVFTQGDPLPTLDELLQQIAAMEAATARANQVAGMTVTAQTLPAGSPATASYADGVLTLGLPKGETGSAGPMKVNGVAGVNDNITLTGGNIPLSAADATTVSAALSQRTRVRNLLDNSDFLHPVNQRGQTTYTGAVFTIDRWRTWDSAASVSLGEEGLTTTATLYQYLDIDPNQTYTAAVCRADGSITCVSGTPSAGMRLNPIAVVVGSNGLVTFTFLAGAYRWAALYQGSYTTKTLPAYLPRGYAAELQACQRYAICLGGAIPCRAVQVTASTMDFTLSLPIALRTAPSFDSATLRLFGLNGTAQTALSGAAFSVAEVSANSLTLRATLASHGYQDGLMLIQAGTVFSSDL